MKTANKGDGRSLGILYIAHEQAFGGATLCLLDLIDQMILRGHRINVLMHGFSGKFHNELTHRNVNVIPTYNYPWVFSRLNGLKTKFLAKNFLNYIAILLRLPVLHQLNLDVIHTNTSYLRTGAQLRKYLKKPHIWHFREFLEENFNLSFVNRERAISYINNNADAIIFVSNALQKKYESLMSQPSLYQVYDGLPDKYVQAKIHKESNFLKLLISGSLNPGKGHVEALHAMAVLRERGINNVFLKIAGQGSTDYESMLKGIVAEKHLQNSVEFIGWQQDMNYFRQEADVELVCSKCEGFGRITIEAMMSMNPVIGANSGATSELVKDGVTGLLYEQGNSKTLAEKILFFLNNRQELPRMGLNAYNWARSFNVEHNATQIEAVYTKVVNSLTV